jgi:hemerythrin-like domain-containing protein
MAASKPAPGAKAKPRRKAQAKKTPAKKATAKSRASARKAPAKAANKPRSKAKTSQQAKGSGQQAAHGIDYGKDNWRGEQPQRKTANEQPMMAALRAEHRHLASIMGLFAQQLDAIEGGSLVDTHVVYEIMDYMCSWPDRYHHPREDLIYGRVAEIDSSAADNVDTLQRDHDQMARRGKEVLRCIEGWREGTVDGTEVVGKGRDYIANTYRHMNTEERLVFPQIESILSAEDWRELSDEDLIKPVADPVFGGPVDREFRNLGRKLRRGVRRSVERGTMVEWIGIEALMEGLEVVSMAAESARDNTGEHLREALGDAGDIMRSEPVSGLPRLVASNTRHTVKWLGDMAELSRDIWGDLTRVNQERKDRIRLLDRF